MHQAMAATLEHCVGEIRGSRRTPARRASPSGRAGRWSILRSPKGWTAPREVDGHCLEGFWRSHQVPMGDVRENPAHLKLLEQWLRSYQPEELFDEAGRLVPELRDLPPTGTRRMSANPPPNGGLIRKPLDIPDFRDYAVEVEAPGASEAEPTKLLGNLLRDIVRRNPDELPGLLPRRDASNRLDALYRGHRARPGWARRSPRTPTAAHLAPDGRVMEMLSEHTLEGWLEGYLLTGRHGFFSTYEAFAHVIDSMVNQHASGWRSATRCRGGRRSRRSTC